MDDVERLFDAMAGEYDELEPWYEHLYARVHAILRQALGGQPASLDAAALDAGCGTGFQTAVLQELGYRAHGIDVSARSLEVARARLPRAAFVRGRLEALPYGDARFDAVSCCGSTLSFVADPARAICELGRVLRPGGRLVLEVEQKWSADLLWMATSALTGDGLGYGITARELWRALARPLREGCVIAYPGYGALRLFTVLELGGFLVSAGLAPTATWGIHSVTGLLPSTLLHRPRLPRGLGRIYAGLCVADRWASRLPPARALASTVVVVATKRLASHS
jgi:ubiquinone/menaquinone biosynthesis C-methylase UbiE